MIDLHSHILPGLDDGAPDLETALAMARIAVRDGIRHVICTPHVLPGVHDNDAVRIAARVAMLRDALRAAEIPLALSIGAEIHLAPALLARLRDGTLPALGQGNGVLVELPSSALPARAAGFVGHLLEQGYQPILAHPERSHWIGTRFETIRALHSRGVHMQVTAGSLLGQFGRPARYWCERMLEEGLVDVIATDAHGVDFRPPRLAAARDRAARLVGEAAAVAMVDTTPAALIASLSLEMPEPDIDPAHLTSDFILSLRERIVALGGLS